MSHRLTIWLLFVLFLVMNGVLLGRLPGLMGDEASEGENVYEIVSSPVWVLTGERSYIGPAIDYIRVPFIFLFGYTTLGVRIPMLLFSVATFWLAAYVLRQMVGREAALFGLVGLVFSPIWLAHQRLGWTISLFPFFTFLILALFIRGYKYSPFFGGFTAGLGLSNHIIFLPTLAGLVAALGLRGLFYWRRLLSYWPALIGFSAGFGIQLAVLLTWREDQGEIAKTASLMGARFHDFFGAWPLFVTGSSYIAHYIADEFSHGLMLTLTLVLSGLALASLLGARRRPAILLLWVWLIVYMPVLMYMIDRFSLRYFVMGSLWVWMMAGIGLYELGCLLLRLSGFLLPANLPGKFYIKVSRHRLWASKENLIGAFTLLIAGCLSIWIWTVLFIPYLRTGGSTEDFPLGNRVDSAAALVDIRPLLACLRGRGPVFSENIHIYNRLLYVSHSMPQLTLVGEYDQDSARFLVHYRLATDKKDSRDSEACPELNHFRVVPV
ncbi:MAG: hypothetical protein HYZ63_01725 [Candidatus Andersenbacteria bacterium]|nr:hypothetical protein [Candidatus Andersenbacteria bacterium]